MITASSPDDWELLAVDGLTFLDRLGDVFSEGQHRLEATSHTYLAVFKADVDLRLAWGLEVDEKLEYDGFAFPDPRITRELVDGFWRGALVARWSVLSVDGHRCYLPDSDRAYVKTGESARDIETIGWTARESDVGLARLLQKLARPSESGREFESYLERAKIVEVPD